MDRSEGCLPNEIVFIRHGESESNVAHSDNQDADSISNLESLYDKSNREHLLSPIATETI